MSRSFFVFCFLFSVCFEVSAGASSYQETTVRLSSMLDKATFEVPVLKRGLLQLRRWGVRSRTHSPYLRGKKQIYRPRLNVRSYSPYRGLTRLLDQQVTYRRKARHHYHWAEEPALYLPAPGKLSIPFSLKSPSTLRFGVGLFPTPHRYRSTSRAWVEVWLWSRGKGVKLFSRLLQRPTPSPLWHQTHRRGKRKDAMKMFSYHQISLRKWVGKKVVIRFVTRPVLSRKERKVIPHVLLSQPVLHVQEQVTAKSPANLLVVLVDTLRARDLGAYGQALKTSPNIDRFAKQGTVFTHAYTVANRTRSAVTAMLASEYPAAMGMHTNRWNVRRAERLRFYKQDPPFLTRVLARSGYALKFIGNNYFLLNLYTRCLDLGFEHLLDFWKDDDSQRITAASLEWLKQNKTRRFFLFVHYNDPHVPYRPPKKWMNAIPGLKKIRRRLRRKYLGEIRRTDHHIGRLLQGLENMGLDKNTLVVFLADHGEVMMPHHGKRTALNRRVLYNHGWSMYDEEYRVPLILRLPGKVPARKRSDTYATLLDLAPTILSLLGLPKPKTYRGRNLMDWLRRPRDQRPLFMEGTIMNAIRWGAWKYIARYGRQAKIKQPDGTWKKVYRELFHLGKDPDERHNLAAIQRKIVQKMRRRLSRHLRELKQRYKELWSKRKLRMR